MAKYLVAFDVDGECWWEVDATSPEEARNLGIERFRNDRFWAQRYPVTPPCAVQEVRPPSSPPHGDLGPYL